MPRRRRSWRGSWSGSSGPAALVAVNVFRTDGWLFGLASAGLAADADGALLAVGDTAPPESLALACSPESVDLLVAGHADVVAASVVAELDAPATAERRVRHPLTEASGTAADARADLAAGPQSRRGLRLRRPAVLTLAWPRLPRVAQYDVLHGPCGTRRV